LVLFCSLSNETHFALGSVWSILHSCATMMVGGLAQGFAFRAGIAIGAGYCGEQGDIYGPVLAEAYRLESEVAVYPRVVLSDDMVNWLRAIGPRPCPSDMETRVTLDLRDDCLDSVMKDGDGVFAIDYLKPKMFKVLGEPTEVVRTICAMKKFVDKMVETHRDNPKVLAKYGWVSDYMTSRIKDEGVT
jgi:hypothetical protein